MRRRAIIAGALGVSFREGSGVEAFEVDAAYIRIGDRCGVVFLSSPVGRDPDVDIDVLARRLARNVASA